ncbi:DUF6328 family protein [Streptomyces sp. NPDC102487]|uniref:DUF6328 family protein n=1 Tax=Streptomyces sp. NPDC102487 TaxID=3366182 RepID=UPI0038268C14
MRKPDQCRGDGSSFPARHGRDETVEERADRIWSGLQQELRVAQIGMQILFGVLLVAAFQPSFDGLGHTDRTLYVAAVTCGACTAGILIGPASLHRVVVGRRIKPQAVRLASWMAGVGLVLLAATTTLVLLVLMRVAFEDTFAAWLVAAVGCFLLVLWLVLPVWAARHYGSLA